MAASRDSAFRPVTLRGGMDGQQSLQRGFATLERTLGPTLGPVGHAVAVARTGRPNQPPELLDDGAVIARRIIGLPESFSNMGLMMARHAAWRMRNEAHDGATTTVLLLAAAHRELLRLQEAGTHRIELARGVERFIDALSAAINRKATPLPFAGLTAFATRTAGDPALGRVISDALDLLGPDEIIVTRASRDRDIRVEYVEGALWESTTVIAPLLAGDAPPRLRFDHPALLLWDGPLDAPGPLARALGVLLERSEQAVVLVARSFSPEVLALLRNNNRPGFQLQAVIAPQAGAEQLAAFDDLAALTGGRRLDPVAGDTLDRLRPASMGSALRVTIGPRFLNLLSHDEHSPAIDRRLASIHRLMTDCGDDKERARLLLRQARLRQGMGVLWIGAPTEPERDARLADAERALATLRLARGGVTPGGGKTLLECADEIASCASPDDARVFRALARACEAPVRWLAINAGRDASATVARSRRLPAGWGYDQFTGEPVDLCAAGLVDPAATLKLAVRIGLGTALEAVDCAMLVHRPVSLSQAEIRP